MILMQTSGRRCCRSSMAKPLGESSIFFAEGSCKVYAHVAGCAAHSGKEANS